MNVKPDQFRHVADGYGVEAMELTEETAEQVKRWCEGQVVWTENPLDEKDIQVGLNFPGEKGMDRLNQGDYLMKVEDGVFKRVAAQLFLSVYERI